MLPLALLLEAGLRHRLTSNAAVAAVMMGTLVVEPLYLSGALGPGSVAVWRGSSDRTQVAHDKQLLQGLRISELTPYHPDQACSPCRTHHAEVGLRGGVQ